MLFGFFQKRTLRGSPLERKRQALREKERKLREHQATLERILQEAPQRREEQKKRRREEFVRKSRANSSTVPLEKQIILTSNMGGASQGQQKPLRSEKRSGLWLFLTLVAMLTGAMLWVLQMLLWH